MYLLNELEVNEIITMSDEEDDYPTKPNIPKLTDDNFTLWSMRIRSFLRRKNLFQYCSELNLPSTADHIKKRDEATDLIIQHLDDTLVDTIITPENNSDPYLIWTEINEKFASQPYNNMRRIWINFIRHQFTDINSYIIECRKLINTISKVNMNIPEEVLSFTILAKLDSDHHDDFVSIMLNENLAKDPEKVLIRLTEIAHIENSRKKVISKDESSSATAMFNSAKFSRITKARPLHPCSPGKHNEQANHPQNKCWHLFPHLRPNYKGCKVILSTATEKLEKEITDQTSLFHQQNGVRLLGNSPHYQFFSAMMF
ncbi:expressed protein [Phakopsora pachyrhizi]|uniref:Expressed protein n=1 Tax=Phakopsora pachyrhizi TaxID=170000 RepID=A0AAV0BIY0_PHAPC|nr:expressed protein [Phakopsora pachyrhizi]